MPVDLYMVKKSLIHISYSHILFKSVDDLEQQGTSFSKSHDSVFKSVDNIEQ